MADSPSHKFGQIIGNMLEAVIEPFLTDFAKRNRLYLDHQRKPRAARKGKRLTWEDPYGNNHNLDFVLERNGTEEKVGVPVAFIEVAWRRYTKHSRNKAQEIQGAILPLSEKHKWSSPFLGAVLSGEFTDGALEQLRSHRFHTLYFPYGAVVTAFAREGIDIDFNEGTPDKDFLKCVRQIERTPPETIDRVKKRLVAANKKALMEFTASLEQRMGRVVERIVIIPLYGRANEFLSLDEAVGFLRQHSSSKGASNFHKYEVLVSFSNGDRVEGSFNDRIEATEFLRFVSKQ